MQNVQEWDKIKDAAMKDILIKKFSDQFMKAKLLQKGDAILIEDSPFDYYWGIGRNKTGLSKLGKLLMEVREEISKL
jgi:N-glycosidase YbiA